MIADYAAGRFGEAVGILETGDPAEKAIHFEEALTNLLHIILKTPSRIPGPRSLRVAPTTTMRLSP